MSCQLPVALHNPGFSLADIFLSQQQQFISFHLIPIVAPQVVAIASW
jgi:hypothetical protein